MIIGHMDLIFLPPLAVWIAQRIHNQEVIHRKVCSTPEFLSSMDFVLDTNLVCCSTYFRHSTDREVALMMLMAYLSYMLAEVCF